jgi:adenosylhomocysteinase
VVATRIDWVREHCRLLRGISKEFTQTRPFQGLTIGTGIHLEAKTVALILTLRDGGARLVSTGNLNTTQPDAVDKLRAEGVRVIGGPTKDKELHGSYLDEVLAAKPDLILDNGGDLFTRYLARPYEGLLGGTEETTSGRMRLEPLRGQLRLPILVINDSPIKQFAENEHAVGQSSLESFMRLTNRATNGEQVTVFGYGACGRGVAANFRGAYARVSVVDTDPVARLRAHLDGFSTPLRDAAVANADFIITVTGARGLLTAADLPLLRDGVILANAGHFPAEIDAEGLINSGEVASKQEYADDLLTLQLRDGRRIHIISRGHMFNLAGLRPLGNSIESMDLGFALQARCLEAVANRSVDATSCVVPVPGHIDAAVADSYLDRKYPPALRGRLLGAPGIMSVSPFRRRHRSADHAIVSSRDRPHALAARRRRRPGRRRRRGRRRAWCRGVLPDQRARRAR